MAKKVLKKKSKVEEAPTSPPPKPTDTFRRVTYTGTCICEGPSFSVRMPTHQRVSIMSLSAFCHTCQTVFDLMEVTN